MQLRVPKRHLFRHCAMKVVGLNRHRAARSMLLALCWTLLLIASSTIAGTAAISTVTPTATPTPAPSVELQGFSLSYSYLQRLLS